jgi:hypothetical protein
LGGAIGVVLLVAACSSPEAAATGKMCVPGEVWRCTCTDGSTGRHTCLEGGDAFDECDCSRRATIENASKGSSGSSGSPTQGGKSGGTANMSMATGPSANEAGSGAKTMVPAMAAGTGGSGSVSGAAASGGSSAGTSGSAGAGVPPTVDPTKPFVTEPTDEAAYLFDQSRVRTYNVLIAAADLAKIDQKPSAEVWVPARLEFEGAMYGPFKVRYKGSAGSFKAPCTTNGLEDPKAGKCSFKLGFDEVDEALRFYGLKKLNFHAMNADASLMRDRLGYSLFRDSNVAAPRAMHAKVLINGKLEGLFVAVEQIDGRFTRARFSEGGEGNVYKESWVVMKSEQDYVSALETNSDAPVVTGMLDFQKAVLTSATAAESFVDRDYMMRYVAVDRVIANDDGAMHFYCDANSPNYPGTSHNFYWYQEAARSHFWLIPWDLDLAFDRTPWTRITPVWTAQTACTCVKSGMYDAQTPPSCDPLVKHFLTWRSDYEREVDKFIGGPFADQTVQAKLNPWVAQIRPFVMETAGVKSAPNVSAWDDGMSALRMKIAELRANRGAKY